MALRDAHPDLALIVRDAEPVVSVAVMRVGEVDIAVVDDLHDVFADGVERAVLVFDE